MPLCIHSHPGMTQAAIERHGDEVEASQDSQESIAHCQSVPRATTVTFRDTAHALLPLLCANSILEKNKRKGGFRSVFYF